MQAICWDAAGLNIIEANGRMPQRMTLNAHIPLHVFCRSTEARALARMLRSSLHCCGSRRCSCQPSVLNGATASSSCCLVSVLLLLQYAHSAG